MKSHLRRPIALRISKKDILFTLGPALLWLVATYARPLLIQTPCHKNPAACSRESVPAIDQLSLGMENPNSDEYSYQTQNFSGLWACALPLVWNLTQSAFIQSTTPVSLVARLIPIGKTVGEDLFILIQTFSWNGLMTELSHLISQRPRPFVYSDPKNRGIDPAHYTSFYSGHTSFTAAMNTAAFFILLRRQAPLIFLLISFACSQGLILSTAYFRILAGRHFLTDVLCGAIAGSIIAYFVVKRNLKDLTRWKF